MPEYDIVYLVEKTVRVVAPSLAHATMQAEGYVRANVPAKLLSVIAADYVEPPEPPKQKYERRDCECQICTGAVAWEEVVLGGEHKDGVDSIPTQPSDE